MCKLKGLSWLKFAGHAIPVKLGVLCLAGLVMATAQAQPANDNFVNAVPISGTAGTVSGINNLATVETGEPTFIVPNDNPYGVNIGATTWYVWTAPASGTVTFDTIGSSFDTVLAVYTGANVSSLTMIGANDDGVVPPQSQFSFFATRGAIYYIQVSGYNSVPSDPSQAAQGTVTLNWTMQTPGFGAGTFRFTSTDYVVSQDESQTPDNAPLMGGTPGARVTVTRVGGNLGRVQVNYSVTNDVFSTVGFALTNQEQITITNYASDGVTVLSYTNISFNEVDNFTQSEEPVTFNGLPPTSLETACLGSVVFYTLTVTNANGIVLPPVLSTNPVILGVGSLLGTNGDGTITLVTSNFTFAFAQVTNGYPSAIARDPKFPNNVWDYIPVQGTLTFNDFEMSKDIFIPMNTNNVGFITNFFVTQGNGLNARIRVNLTSATLDPNEFMGNPSPGFNPPSLDTNRNSTAVDVLNVWQALGSCGGFGFDVFNFERSTLRVSRSQGKAQIDVLRGEFSDGNAATIWYRIDHAKKDDDWNTFPLQAGSDYAVPDNATKNGNNDQQDFTSQVGSLTWADGNFDPKTITVQLQDNGVPQFDKDFVIEFFADKNHQWSQNAIPGNIVSCTVTILNNTLPAGSVDVGYNVDNNGGTYPRFNQHPGVDGPVYAVAVQPDGRALYGGDFVAYNSTNAVRIARALANGQADPNFDLNIGLGADAFVDAIALDATNNIYIGGGFFSFNGFQRNGVARLNPNGTLDTTGFLPGSGVNGTVKSILIQPDGKILIAGDFSTYNATNRNCIARLNPDGTVDPTFDPGIGPIDDVNPGGTIINSMALQTNGDIVIGGDFTSVDGASRSYIARLNPDGSLDGTFDSSSGANDVIYAVAVDANGFILAGGAFTQYGTLGGSAGITRLSPDGTLDTSFNAGSGADDVINTIALQPDGGILLGGIFTSINQTRRISIARLLPDGEVDTSFLDTAYNQFAGLINPYYDPNVNPPNPVNAMALQPDGNILIGGSFTQVGGGYERTDIHPRSNLARLIGGSTAGPGNIAMGFTSYSGDASSGGTSQLITIVLNRNNGSLGPAAATLEPVPLQPGPGAAVYGQDYIFSSTTVGWRTTWNNTWMLSDGVSGNNNFPAVTVLSNNNANATVNLQLTQPIGSDIFFLGGFNKKSANSVDAGLFAPAYVAQDGENIPLGVALGLASAPLTIIHNPLNYGVLNLNPQGYIVNENSNRAVINVFRTGGGSGSVTVKYKTINGTALNGVDYTTNSGTLTFPPYPQAGWSNQVFSGITILDNGQSHPDRIVNLQIYTPGGGASLGVTNSTLEIINDHVTSGFVDFVGGTPAVIGTSNVMTYGTNENSGAAMVTLSRLGGNQGVLSVYIATGGGTAANGINYSGFTNQITWQNGIGGPTNIFIPLIDDGVATSNLTVNLRLFGTTVGGTPNGAALGGAYTNALLTITNTDSPGVLQFSLPVYSFNKNGGQALITVTRTNGTAGTISVNFATLDGTAYSNTDYMATNGTLVFTNGQMARSFSVPIINNSIVEGNLFLSMILTNASPAVVLGSPSNATLNIVDTSTYDYPPGSPDVSYSSLAGFNGSVFGLALEPSDGKLVVGGGFTTANGITRNRIARLNTDGSLDVKFSSYLPGQGANDIVRTVAVQTDGRILVGGYFTNFNGAIMNHIARLNYNGSLDSSFNPGSGADSTIFALAETFVGGQRKIIIGGGFTTYGGVGFNYNGVARLNNNGTVDTTFSPGTGANGTIYAVAMQPDGRILVGGDFTVFNGIPFNHIARLNPNGSVDMTFSNALVNPATGADGSVHAIAVQLDGRILIGGLFTNVNGVVLNHIARLNADGTVDPGFTPGAGANDDVQTISLQADARILLGGNFTLCNGVTRNHVTRLNPDGTVDLTINFGLGANGFVAASAIQNDGNIILGGGFTTYNGFEHDGVVRIYGGSTSGSGAFTFTSANYQSNETNTPAIITVLRTGGTAGTNSDGSGDVFVNFSTSDGTGVANVNYSNVNVNLDFPPGEVIRTVPVPLIPAVTLDPTVTVNLTLTNATPPAALGVQPFAMLNILNNLSAINFALTNYTVAKNVASGKALIDVLRLGDTNGTSTVDFYTTTNGTAVTGTDYTPASGTLTFNPGDSDRAFQIAINNNGLVEGDRTVGLALTNVTGSLLFSPSNSTLTIRDTVVAYGQLSLTTNSYVVGEGDGTAHIPVVRTGGSSGIVSVNYQTLTTGSAVPGTSYVTTNGVLTFGDGITSGSIDVPILQNAYALGPVNFAVMIYNPAGGATLVQPTNAVVTILDDHIGLAFAQGTNTISETGGAITLNVLRLNVSNVLTTVHYSTTNGTALAGVNYAAASGTLTFATNETVKPLVIPVLYDTNVTGDVYFNIGLSSPSAPAQLVAPSVAKVIVQDVDAGLHFDTNATTVLKNAGTAVINVICSNTNAEPVSVNYATSDGTAKQGVNYQSISGTLTFSNGLAETNFTVTILNNNQVSSNLSFNVSLSGPTPPGQVIQPSNEVVTIQESNPGFEFSSPIYTALKGVTVQATINVYRLGYTNSVASVDFLATNGTAIPTNNYIPTGGTLVFNPGVTNQSFPVTIVDYPVVQPDLTVLLQLLNPTGGYLLTPSAAVLTIHDVTGSFVVPAGSTLVSETGAGAPNGIIDSNETVTLLFAFRDAGGTNVANLIATLLATNGVTAPSPASQSYSNLTYLGHSVSRAFTFTAQGTNGQPILATFQLQDGVKPIGTAVFGYTLGSLTSTFATNLPIVINSPGAGSPYPSVLNVNGVGGTLVKTTVTLTNLSESAPGDIGVLLVAPDQLNTLLMGNVGGQNAIGGVTLTFDDAASNSLPHFNQITSGTNKPTVFAPTPTFP